MHVCRNKIGDGTLLTSIYDLNKGIVNLYFYHDYNNVVAFNLKEELAKGNHSFEIPSLFPANAEYQKLLDFKTPMNSASINLFMRFCILIFLISTIYFFVSYIRNRKIKYAPYKLLLSSMCLIMMYYIFVLAREINIFYFPAPYKGYYFSMLDFAAYIPFLTLLLIIPLLLINRKVFTENAWRNLSIWLFTINNLIFLTLIILFTYWGLYDVFN